MASFPSMILTNAGKNMIVQAQLGQELIFTKGKYGSGTLAEGADQASFVDLISPMLDLPIQNMTSETTGQATVTVLVDRTNLTTGFFGRELGLFAKIGESGTEQLFCYTNAGTQADFIPAGTDDTIPYNEFIDIITVIGNAANVSIIVDQTKIYVTRAEFEDKLSKYVKLLDFTQSLSAAGWTKLPNGLIIQWGGFSGTTNYANANGVYEAAPVAVNWPVVFPNGCYRVICCVGDVTGGGLQEQCWLGGYSKNQGNFYVACRANNATIYGDYIAIGR